MPQHRTLEKILFVEDDPHIQKIARISLERIGGFEVRTCSSGEEALEAVPEYHPDLILMDVMMPGMGGIETMNELRQIRESRSIPVILLTALAQTHEVENFRGRGCIDVITKPFDPMELPASVRDIWKRWIDGVSR